MAKYLGALIGLVLVAGLARGYFAFRDRHPGYQFKLNTAASPGGSAPGALRVGFARVKTDPDISDPAHPIFLAGFGENRKATAIHDDLWAIACVIESGSKRWGIVSLDAIGFFEDDVIRVRQKLSPEWKLDFTTICSTHNHSTPDLMGLWGPHHLRSGVDPVYLESVREACVKALGDAVTNLQNAAVAFHEIPTETAHLVADTRKPIVFDPDIRVMHFVVPSTGATLGTIVTWGDHPETPWSENTEVTADFCGYLRDAMEHGIAEKGTVFAAGLGGTHLYINGAIGGLMTTPPSLSVLDPYLKMEFQKPSHEKARALGRQLASRILPVLLQTNTQFQTQLPLTISARTITLPLANNIFLLAGYLGILDRGYVAWRTLRTEVGLITLGDASIACVPGEIYPEIVNGGVEQAPGGDFPVAPVEIPPLRQLMPAGIKFVFGLANDEVGYLIPKSEWDGLPPYIYGAEHAPYGEINSVGPDAAGCVHKALKELCTEAIPGSSRP